MIGTVLLVATLLFAWRVLRAGLDRVTGRFALAFAGGLCGQYALGIATLVNLVPVGLGIAHQLTALVLLGIWLSWLHHVRNARLAT